MRVLRRLLVIVLAMSGVFTTGLTPLRIFTSALVVAGFLALGGVRLGPAEALGWFAVVFALRYVLLFGSFGPRGIAGLLRRRLGTERGFAIYESVTALFFFARTLTFTWLVQATPWPASGLGPVWDHSLDVSGLGLSLLGLLLNVWATMVIGLPAYFYRDLFLGDGAPLEQFKAEGPYRWLAHPMYGLGQASSYGLALAAHSPIGLAAALLNQLAMWWFVRKVEHPHLLRLRRAALGAASLGLAPGA